MYSYQVVRARLTLAIIIVSSPALALSQTPASTESVYRTPSQVLVDIIDAPPTPSVSIDPNEEWMLLTVRPSLAPIAELAERELRLAGLRINPRIYAPSRTRYSTSMKLRRISDLTEREITGLPKEPRIGNVRWSPDGAHIAFTHTTEKGVELWVAEVATGKAKRLTRTLLNLIAESPTWLSDNKTLVCTVLPTGRRSEPEAPKAPSGPVIQENIGQTAPARTYQDLLTNSYDEALFEYYLTSQVAKVTLKGKVTRLSDAGLIRNVSPSPDGEYLLVETIHRPFSYLVTNSRFPKRVEVWDLNGRVVRQIADLPLQEGVPIPSGSVPTGPRSFGWRADAAATLTWTEALDGGDAGAKAEVRDQVYMLAAPFQTEPVPWITLALRYSGITWGTDDLALVSESWRRTRKSRTWIVKPGSPQSVPVILFDRNTEDRYSDPGRPIMTENAMGRNVLLTANNCNTIYLTGTGSSPEGDRPFFNEFDLTTRESERLFRSEAPFYEQPLQFLGEDGATLLTRRESVEEPPNYFIRDLRDNTLRQITFFPHTTPQLIGYQKELIHYQREDGVQLTGTLCLPSDYKPEDGPLPMVMWAYPREFKSAQAAGQVSGSPYRFSRLSYGSPLLWLAVGYTVLDNPTMPIIGEGDEEPNDRYVEQLVASAKAAVDEVVRRGVADHNRIAIGGHSYGAFMTANLLAHSDLFAAGIARSGAYNRTLTPFGFQAEERTYWQAPDIYFAMSPFMHADHVNEPILLIHGEMDNNSGTFPIQSIRFYNALKGHGATARLVMLPYESHGYSARESIMHMLWESEQWLDTFVKGTEMQ